jgi:hypothetical protein
MAHNERAINRLPEEAEESEQMDRRDETRRMGKSSIPSAVLVGSSDANSPQTTSSGTRL